MGGLQVEVDPEELGFDRGRLERIDSHFARYVDDGRLAGWNVLVARHGRVVHLGTHGLRDEEAGAPVELDTLFRIYSMTKPVTSVAAMQLLEEGAFELKDPVHRYIPAFRDARVYRRGSAVNPQTEPMAEPMRIWHLFTHMSGLTYGFHHAHPVDAMYREAGYEWGAPSGTDLEAACETWASLPLLFQPGSEWNYGVSTDVLGRVVEVAAGKPLDQVLAERIFAPLGMHDTAFHAAGSEHDRMAALYVALPGGGRMRHDAMGAASLRPPTFLSGGGGLVSTLADYHRFLRALLGGGAVDGVRLLGSRTMRYMVQNHLPRGVDLEAIGRPLFAETAFDGVGFGLGFSVVLDGAAGKVVGGAAPGTYAWGGAASTAFWVDPAEGITAIFMTQLLPSSTHPIRSQLQNLVYQALVD